MADTLANTTVQQGVWTNLYAASGVAAGTAVTVVNVGSSPVKLAIKLTAPASTTLGLPLYSGPVGSVATVSAGETGLWAYSPDGVAYVNVQV